ncbi:hypothetical protein FACS189485_06960 [Spirochaetia bacterium]|nr:hypothetical protein FACS189485_06960 [Spirochaetia bacterium]
MVFKWNEEKNNILKNTRNISFEEIVIAINNGNLIDTIINPNQIQYKGQAINLVKINNYIYAVPSFIIDDNCNLITIYKSRKYTRLYLKEPKDDE